MQQQHEDQVPATPTAIIVGTVFAAVLGYLVLIPTTIPSPFPPRTLGQALPMILFCEVLLRFSAGLIPQLRRISRTRPVERARFFRMIGGAMLMLFQGTALASLWNGTDGGLAVLRFYALFLVIVFEMWFFTRDGESPAASLGLQLLRLVAGGVAGTGLGLELFDLVVGMATATLSVWRIVIAVMLLGCTLIYVSVFAFRKGPSVG